MYLNTIKPAEGSKKAAKRVGRGIGSGLGKTSGKGHKGQRAFEQCIEGDNGGTTIREQK